MDRSRPQRKAPEGYRFEVVPADPTWRIANEEEHARKCRWSTKNPCPNPSVLALRRPRSGFRDGVWWFYCAEHAYAFGRWIEDGTVMYWVLVRDGAGE